MEPVGEHQVPSGPLAVRWHGWSFPTVQAGAHTTFEVELENAGLAPWQDDVYLSYHWLDERGNAIVWDGTRTPLSLAPGERARVTAGLQGPIPPGRYRFALDLLREHRFWFGELGNHVPEREVEVRPRDASGAQAHLPEGAEPASDWHDRVRALHEEGYSAVGGSVTLDSGVFRRGRPELEPYAPGGGRNPAFRLPLVCPSLLPPLVPNTEVAGLPAWRPVGDLEPWMYDARVALRLRSRSGRRRG